jgi:hypothetical protein
VKRGLLPQVLGDDLDLAHTGVQDSHQQRHYSLPFSKSSGLGKL